MWTIRFAVIALVALPLRVVSADDPVPDAVDWYENQYAPLYEQDPGDHAAEIGEHFSISLTYFPADGPADVVNGPEWIRDAIAGWLAEGWTYSKLVAAEHERINDSTVTFKAKWHDFYSDGGEAFACGWYLGRLEQTRWVVAQYADLDCAEHGL